MNSKTTIILIFILGFISYSGFGQNLGNIETHEALIYPNPLVGERFMVKSNSLVSKVEVVNVIGKLINRTVGDNKNQDLIVDIGNCEKGLYLVKVTFNDEKSIIKKLLVK
ncbi:MAG: T9SS type A sorting domain-containing protein [Bacteroidales bacterium]|nr:T9SS type A sorting domain-containing protein [Bacteroidales bacterium]MBN2757045.1 T9SS type A sorting domain-containing protein [Bacteroidales bacterium]